MPKNLPQVSNKKLIGFELRISISSLLLERIESNNEDVYFNFMCGKQALIDNRFKTAIDYFDKVIIYFENKPIDSRYMMKLGRKTPYDEYINSFLLRGNANYSLKDNDKALEDYSRCIAIDNSVNTAYRNRAVCYMNQRQFDRAIFDLLQITTNTEFCPEIHRYLGYSYQYIGDPDKSRLHFSISETQGNEESNKLITNPNTNDK